MNIFLIPYSELILKSSPGKNKMLAFFEKQMKHEAFFAEYKMLSRDCHLKNIITMCVFH